MTDVFQAVCTAVEAFETSNLLVQVDMPDTPGDCVRVIVAAVCKDGKTRFNGCNFTDAARAQDDAIVRIGVALGRVYDSVETAVREAGTEAVDVGPVTFMGGRL